MSIFAIVDKFGVEDMGIPLEEIDSSIVICIIYCILWLCFVCHTIYVRFGLFQFGWIYLYIFQFINFKF